MAQKAKTAAFRVIAPWIKSITNHLYWCIYSSEYEEEREFKWRFLLDHIVDRHQDCPHTSVSPKQWLTKGKFDKLFCVPKCQVRSDFCYN